MRVLSDSFRVRTAERICVRNVSEEVRKTVRSRGGKNGLVHVSIPHTTCALCVNEDEPGLTADIEHVAAQILSPIRKNRSFEHDNVDDNAQAHLTSILFGHSVTLPLQGGEIGLGTWQSILLVEMDGPRMREIGVQILTDE